MAAQLGLLSMTQQSQHHRNPSLTTPMWMWNPMQLKDNNNNNDDDDSWEVRAFAEDTASIHGTTWPPRSYTCTFCRREFQSAQALGGHMNVHRRDRAKLHQNSNSFNNISNSSPSPNSLIPSHQEFASNGGGFLLYQSSNPNGLFCAQMAMNSACTANTMSSSPSTLLSMSPYPPSNLVSPSMNLNLVSPPGKMNFSTHSYYQSSKDEASISISKKNWEKTEELDLELRLGHR
ncbi:hypothetical protein HS088_TW15G00569 [Tripterygium wilfordii]|uniref:C2H2-type domain-containing protein n=1 Tax=Tripterygium wilfordii TaxID=458696 RepID=A0A7J7CLX9_TRIWF|nr:zinc finger protein 10-like [Tripterygium wilfordii]KAF5735070.1 hypothetical protein HS088_TW15G00569 [Tripterygium wilfordii]